MSHARETMDPGILSIPGRDDPGMSHARETMDPGIPGTILGCPMLGRPWIPEY